MKIKNNVLICVKNEDFTKDGKIVIPDGVTKIGKSAFKYCKKLKEIYIPKSMTKIGDSAFEECENLERIHIPNSVTEIGEAAFYGCEKLKEIYIPDSVTEIGNSVFWECSNLKEIHISESVTKIGKLVFWGCINLKEIYIPESVSEIEYSAFTWCTNLEKIHIPDNVTEIEESVFRRCENLKEIHIPESATEIEDSAFCGCTNLKEIHIPDSVTKIGKSVFFACKNLKKITWGKDAYKIECIDDYCMQVLSEKQKDGVTIKRCKYFPDGKTVYVAQKDDLSAHGETIHEAVDDLMFKYLELKDVSENLERIKKQGYMNANDYCLLTGACREGTNRFLEEHHLTWEDTLPVEKVLELTKGHYGYETFEKHVKTILS